MRKQDNYWLNYAKATFIIAAIAMIISIIKLPGDLIVKGYYSICSLFLVSATITLSKAIRDNTESNQLMNKIEQAKTAKLLNEFDE
ncbi:YiaAB two helix domain protein [Photobacterium kishitanii]|uniref:YiaAB two helix domain-containing protein n=1 Tax=Photobacterium kishitanii TaxID=318456 RepID=A0AAX0Z0Y7_9GAMM|nr:YiaA/YiaB family inner membrane protein [Photobacterium kishitanii]KJG11494.1 YiaAB two helix domain protein [Photobacterium kishitanii]KJG56630.1 YiaAB two helix domain protein [Photobacterium kishitanii]KJG61051.1 YiaAB two helix domain protein [Photobacterium kishitanii]KJG65215.1 YiaAB two helix domain protein [Photobacterium kishitanii]KJG68859.1 YiaAB two helix domain protein [Photobacterium kishitanii]